MVMRLTLFTASRPWDQENSKFQARNSPSLRGTLYLEDVEDLPYRKCVGIVVLNCDNLVFAGQRIDGIDDAWQMPQGGIDEGEDNHSAALRELEEETGISSDLVQFVAETKGTYMYDLPIEMIPNLWGGKYRGQEQKWFLFDFIGNDSQININTSHPEFSNWQWMKTGQLVKKIVPFKRLVYESIFNEFREHMNY